VIVHGTLCFFYSLSFIYHYNAIHVSAVLFNNKATSDSVLMGAFVCCGSVCLQRLHHLWNPLWKELASFENRRLPWICSSLLFLEPTSTYLLVSSSLSSTDSSGSARERIEKECSSTLPLVAIKALFICWKVSFFFKVNFGKVNYFLMFGSVMENKLENTFQCLVISWKMSWKIIY